MAASSTSTEEPWWRDVDAFLASSRAPRRVDDGPRPSGTKGALSELDDISSGVRGLGPSRLTDSSHPYSTKPQELDEIRREVPQVYGYTRSEGPPAPKKEEGDYTDASLRDDARPALERGVTLRSSEDLDGIMRRFPASPLQSRRAHVEFASENHRTNRAPLNARVGAEEDRDRPSATRSPELRAASPAFSAASSTARPITASSGKAVLGALRSLQEKIRRLEGERDLFKSRFEASEAEARRFLEDMGTFSLASRDADELVRTKREREEIANKLGTAEEQMRLLGHELRHTQQQVGVAEAERRTVQAQCELLRHELNKAVHSRFGDTTMRSSNKAPPNRAVHSTPQGREGSTNRPTSSSHTRKVQSAGTQQPPFIPPGSACLSECIHRKNSPRYQERVQSAWKTRAPRSAPNSTRRETTPIPGVRRRKKPEKKTHPVSARVVGPPSTTATTTTTTRRLERIRPPTLMSCEEVNTLVKTLENEYRHLRRDYKRLRRAREKLGIVLSPEIDLDLWLSDIMERLERKAAMIQSLKRSQTSRK